MKSFGIEDEIFLRGERLLPEGCEAGHPLYTSDVVWVLGAVVWWFVALHVWTVFISPTQGAYRTVDLGFLRRLFPGLAQSVDDLITVKLTIDNAETRAKFSSATWRMMTYLVLNTVTYYCLFVENDWFHVNNWCALWLKDWPTQPTTMLRRFYLFRLSYAIHALLSVLLYDRQKSDFWMYVVHHCVESLLIATSLLLNFTRIGLYLFAIHDPSDFWLQLGKIPTYVIPGKLKRGEQVPWLLKNLPTLCFFPFFLTWLVLRLIALPWLLGWMFWRYPGHNSFPGNCKPFWHWGFYVFIPLLLSLVILHLVWFRLIVRMAIEQVSGKRNISSAGDIRERPKNEKDD